MRYCFLQYQNRKRHFISDNVLLKQLIEEHKLEFVNKLAQY
jgi:hypothetical protein